jgi:hypothetical protein
VSGVYERASWGGELGIPTPMKQSYRWLDSQSHHACNHIIVMCHTLPFTGPLPKGKNLGLERKRVKEGSYYYKIRIQLRTMKTMAKSMGPPSFQDEQNLACKASND